MASEPMQVEVVSPGADPVLGRGHHGHRAGRSAAATSPSSPATPRSSGALDRGRGAHHAPDGGDEVIAVHGGFVEVGRRPGDHPLRRRRAGRPDRPGPRRAGQGRGRGAPSPRAPRARRRVRGRPAPRPRPHRRRRWPALGPPPRGPLATYRGRRCGARALGRRVLCREGRLRAAAPRRRPLRRGLSGSGRRPWSVHASWWPCSCRHRWPPRWTACAGRPATGSWRASPPT